MGGIMIQVYCFSISGGVLNSEISNMLFEMSCDMFADKLEVHSRETNKFCIGVETTFATGVLGGIGGIIFSATVEWIRTIRVLYMVHTELLEMSLEDREFEIKNINIDPGLN